MGGALLQQSTPALSEAARSPEAGAGLRVPLRLLALLLPPPSGSQAPDSAQDGGGVPSTGAAAGARVGCSKGATGAPHRGPNVHRAAGAPSSLQGGTRDKEGWSPQRRYKGQPGRTTSLGLTATPGLAERARCRAGPLRRVCGQSDQRQGLSAHCAGEASGTCGDAWPVHRGPLPQVWCCQPHTGAPAGATDRWVLWEVGPADR